MPALNFSDSEIVAQARVMGLLDDDGTVPARHRSVVVRALAEDQHPQPEPQENDDPTTITITVEIKVGEDVLGASVTHVPLPKGTHRA